MKELCSRKILLGAFAATIAVGVSGASLVPYVNDFSQRTSAAIPSGRWMETVYQEGLLAKPLASGDITASSPYKDVDKYQDGWAARKIWNSASGNTAFTVVNDGGNQALVANGLKSGSYDADTTIVQPLGNEFKDGILKISVDIRTPPSGDSFKSSRGYALFAPLFKSELNVTSSAVGMPLYFGPGSINESLRAISRGRDSSGSESFFGQSDSRNNIVAGTWMRYEAVLDLSAGTYTATFSNLGTSHPNPQTWGDNPVAFRQYEGNANTPTTFSFVTAQTDETGGVAGLAFLVNGLAAAEASAAPMFDNVAVSWKAPGSDKFVSVYENDFSVRRYRSLEPAGTTAGAYTLSVMTNTVYSAGYDHGSWTYTYGVSESSAGLLVPESGVAGSGCEGWDGWRRRAGALVFRCSIQIRTADTAGKTERFCG